MSKKAAKTDIAAIEYALADLDPADGETPEAAKARYLAQLNDVFEPKPTAGVDSGNGIQGLWKLKERIVLGKPVNGKFSPEDQAKIDDVEARIAAVMRRLGSKAGTQNIDRILRLPGTTNLPNAKKRKEGRVACQTKLLWFDDVSYPLDAFPKENGGARERRQATKRPGKRRPRRKRQRLRLPLHAGLPRQGDELPGGARGNPGRQERGRRMGQSRRRAATRTRLGAQQAVANSG